MLKENSADYRSEEVGTSELVINNLQYKLG